MDKALPSQNIHRSSLMHLRLIDSFIETTRFELDRHDCIFIRESLAEMIEQLNVERENYRFLSEVRLVEPAA